jgi:hypothetical protein
MAFEEEEVHCQRSQIEAVVGGVLRVVLLFGPLMVVAFALIFSHLLDARPSRDLAESQTAAGLDTMPTGSIGYANGVCIPRDNGTPGGNC